MQNALEQADQYASRENKKKVSIVFPLFGTGSAQGELVSAAQSLFHAVLRYFETKQNSKVDNVYFLVWKEYERETCVKILDSIQVLTPKNPS